MWIRVRLYRRRLPCSCAGTRTPTSGPRRHVLEGLGAIALRAMGSTFTPTIDGVAVDDEFACPPDVTRHVSRVAKMQRVRAWVNEVRIAARNHNVVADGRDMGTAVFPDADLKVFLVADPWERARRRLIQRLERHPTDDEIAERPT